MAFSPRGKSLDAVLMPLRSARRSVDASLFYLSHQDLIDTLCGLASDGGVQVRVVVDVEAATPSERHVLEKLVANGVRVYVLPVANGKMHMKCAVVDEELVLTGAANWTPQAFERNVEDTIALRSPDLARRYTEHFNQLVREAQVFEPLPQTGPVTIARPVGHPFAPPGRAATIDEGPGLAAVRADVFFSPGREGQRALAQQIAAATDRVDVAMYLFNDAVMVQALIDKAATHTASVRVIVDSGMLTGSLRPVLQSLTDAGVRIAWWNADRSNLHLKTAVIDGRYLWTGSANWTPSAFDRNVEDMLMLDAPAVATSYAALIDSVTAASPVFQPVGATSFEVEPGPPPVRNGFPVGLPPTGPRTNWSRAARAPPYASFSTTASMQYLPDEQYFAVLLELLRTARQSILIAMYVLPEMKPGEPLKAQVIDALVSAAQRGVYVYLLLHMTSGEGDAIAQAHEDWAERLRAKGVDVRLHVPTMPVHDKLIVVDLSKILIGSHNWTEGALSGDKVYEAAALLVLPRQDIRWADYVLGLEPVSDMRSRALWDEELRRLRQLDGLSGGAREAFVRQLEVGP